MKAFLLSAVIVLVSACASLPPVPVKSTFNPQEWDSYVGTGTGEIRGQAFLRQQGGAVVTCAGEIVRLFPNTTITREAMQIFHQGREPEAVEAPAGYNSTYRETYCDAQGNFLFRGLKEGSWMILTKVSWVVDNKQQGAELLTTVDVHEGMQSSVILSDRNRL